MTSYCCDDWQIFRSSRSRSFGFKQKSRFVPKTMKRMTKAPVLTCMPTKSSVVKSRPNFCFCFWKTAPGKIFVKNTLFKITKLCLLLCLCCMPSKIVCKLRGNHFFFLKVIVIWKKKGPKYPVFKNCLAERLQSQVSQIVSASVQLVGKEMAKTEIIPKISWQEYVGSRKWVTAPSRSGFEFWVKSHSGYELKLVGPIWALSELFFVL